MLSRATIRWRLNAYWGLVGLAVIGWPVGLWAVGPWVFPVVVLLALVSGAMTLVTICPRCGDHTLWRKASVIHTVIWDVPHRCERCGLEFPETEHG